MAAFLRFLEWLVCAVPIRFLDVAAGFLGRFRGLARRDVTVLRTNLAVILGLRPGSAEARGFEIRCFRGQLAAILETIRLSRDPAGLDVRNLPGFPEFRRVLRAAEREGRGQILVTAHLGAWELLAQSAVAAGERPVCAVAKPLRSASASAYIKRLRVRAGVRVIWGGGRMLLRAMVRTIRQGETLILLVDQRPDLRRGPWVEFLGRQTEFVGGPAALATRCDCPVIAAFCLREGPLTYRLDSESIRQPGDSRDPDELSQGMAAAIEQRVRAWPVQWMWNYRRWTFSPAELAAAGVGDAERRT